MKPLFALFLTASLSLPALAGIDIDKIQVTGAGSDAAQPRVTVALRNTGKEAVRVDKVVLDLKGPKQQWVPVQSWVQPRLLAPGEQITVHIAPAVDSQLGRAILGSVYHLQARATFQPAAVGDAE